MLKAWMVSGVLVGAIALAGCGDSDDTPPVDIGGDPTSGAAPSETATPTATPKPTPTTPAGDPAQADEVGNDVYPRRNNTKTAEEQAVAQAWFDYWTARVESYGSAEVSPDIGALATGNALTGLVNTVETLAAQGHYTEGDLIIDVDRVVVDGDTATVRSCMQNFGTDRDASGKKLENVRPFLDATGSLERADGAWRLATLEVTDGGPC